MGFWQGKRLVVAIAGGIAAYKSLELIRRLTAAGARVDGVLTAAGGRFVTPLSMQSLLNGTLHQDLFSLTEEREMGHIRLAREPDLVVVAPATADLLGKMAHGLAGDLLSALLLARRGPVLVAPAMNSAMWENPATRRNVAQLRADGIHMVGPGSGPLACGEAGPGRMAEPGEILEAARRVLTEPLLAGRRILVTAGPTREPVDPVRYVGNRSSGKMGFAVATAAARLGAAVDLVHGPVAEPLPWGVTPHPVETAREMAARVAALWPHCHGAVMTAAVADFRPREAVAEKIKKGADPQGMTLALIPNPDILAATVAARRPGQLVVGFAAETGRAVERGREKLARKGCDLLLVNDVAEAGSGFGSETNRVTLLTREGAEEAWPLLPKERVAERLLARMAEWLAGNGGEAARAGEASDD